MIEKKVLKKFVRDEELNLKLAQEKINISANGPQKY